MNKIASIVVVLAMSVIAAVAVPSISLNMQDSNGVFTDASLTTPVGSGMLVLLVWSADSTINIPTVGSIPSTRGSAFGSDYVLFSGFGDSIYGLGSDLDGGINYTSTDVGGNSIVGGYAYIMLFQSSAPIAGTKYVVSPMTFPLADSSAPQPPSPDGVDLAGADGAYFGQPGLSGSVAAVPEPSTVGLLLVGASLIGLRRFRRS